MASSSALLAVAAAGAPEAAVVAMMFNLPS